MRRGMMLAALGLLPLSGNALNAQTPPARAYSFVTDDADRPRLGVSTRSSGVRDTLGLLISDVTRGSPAEKAGLEEGDRLISVNGVNLRLSRDDAEDEAMSGVATRRLTRELAKHKAGDEVELRVYRDGQSRTVRARLVDAEDIEGEGRSVQSIRAALRDRVVLGVSLGGTGSRRDTLGVLVVGVTDSGPAALAGIEEGDRIAAVNGVDLRVDREDAGDWESSNVRIRRLNRALEKVKPGDDVELRIYSQGQTRTVRAKAARASDLRGRSGAFFFNDGRTFIREPLIRPAPMPMIRPGLKLQPRIYYSPGVSVDIDAGPRVEMKLREALERVSERSREAQIRTQETLRRSEEALRRALEAGLRYRIRTDIDDDADTADDADAATAVPVSPRTPAARVTSPRIAAAGGGGAVAVGRIPAKLTSLRSGGGFTTTASGGGFAAARPSALFGTVPLSRSGDAMIIVGGLRLAPIDADLAAYLGADAERGLLVVQRSERWPGLREGDVILSIDGRPVRREDGSTSVSLRDVSQTSVELLRGGKRMEVKVER